MRREEEENSLFLFVMNPNPKIHVGLLRRMPFPDDGLYRKDIRRWMPFQIDIILGSARGREPPECWMVISLYSGLK